MAEAEQNYTPHPSPHTHDPGFTSHPTCLGGWSVQAQEPLLTFHAHTLTDPGLEKFSGVSWVPAHS